MSVPSTCTSGTGRYSTPLWVTLPANISMQHPSRQFSAALCALPSDDPAQQVLIVALLGLQLEPRRGLIHRLRGWAPGVGDSASLGRPPITHPARFRNGVPRIVIAVATAEAGAVQLGRAILVVIASCGSSSPSLRRRRGRLDSGLFFWPLSLSCQRRHGRLG